MASSSTEQHSVLFDSIIAAVFGEQPDGLKAARKMSGDRSAEIVITILRDGAVMSGFERSN